ncbi:unnamed protein product, partial [marine sediment metagenome]
GDGLEETTLRFEFLESGINLNVTNVVGSWDYPFTRDVDGGNGRINDIYDYNDTRL